MKNQFLSLPAKITGRLAAILCAATGLALLLPEGLAAPAYYQPPANAEPYQDTSVTLVKAMPGAQIADFAVVLVALRVLSADRADPRQTEVSLPFWHLPSLVQQELRRQGPGAVLSCYVNATDSYGFRTVGGFSPGRPFSRKIDIILLSVQSPTPQVIAATLALRAQDTATLERTGSGNYYQQANPTVVREIIARYFKQNANASPIHQEISALLKADTSGDFLALAGDEAGNVINAVKGSRTPRPASFDPAKHPQTVQSAADLLLKEHIRLWGQLTEVGKFLSQPPDRFKMAINVAKPVWPMDKVVEDVISHLALRTNGPLLKNCGTADPAVAARIILDAAYTNAGRQR